MSNNQPGRVRQALRRGTAAAHHALDHHPLMQRLTGSGLTRELYAESLAAMYRPHVRLERQVHESRHHFETGLKLSARIELLETDLLELGWPVSPISHIRPDPLEARATWWGRLYVLEGSRQGGAVIARCIHSSLGTTVPSRFFDDAVVPDHHDAMAEMRDRELQRDEDLDQAVASALAAFAPYLAELESFCRAKRGDRIWPGESA